MLKRVAVRRSRVVLLMAILVAACVSSPEEPPNSADETASAPAPEKRPTFADAMDTRTPLARVAGAHQPLDVRSRQSADRFGDAVQYAMDMESYSLLIWKDGELLLERYFEPHDENLRPDSASMHKTVAALLVGVAVGQGAIASVDDRVGKYIPEWNNDARGDIEIRHLLEMNTGLQPLSTEGDTESVSYKFWMEGSDARAITLSMQQDYAPEEKFHYLNAATQLLCLILENATKQPYVDYLSKNLWQPLKAKDAFVWLNEPTGFPRAYTALMARPRSWLRVGLLIKDFGQLGGRQLVPEAYVREMTSPSPTNANYGWQIWLGNEFDPERHYNHLETGFGVMAGEPFALQDLIYLDGFGGQRVYISRSENLVIIRTGNQRLDWDDARLPNSILAALSP